MNDRDRQILWIGGIIAAILVLYLAVLRPLNNAVADLDGRVHDRQAALNDVKRLSDEYRQLKASLPQGSDNVNLLSYIEGLARQAEMKANIEYMKPGSGVVRGPVRRSSVEIKLVKVNLKQLTNLLFQIERGGRYPLRIDELHIKKRYDSPDLLDVTIEVYQG